MLQYATKQFYNLTYDHSLCYLTKGYDLIQLIDAIHFIAIQYNIIYNTLLYGIM